MKHAIFYCYHVSHVLNIGKIPTLLREKGWRVSWLNKFPKELFPRPIDEDIDYSFDFNLEDLGAMSGDLYITPFVGQNSHFPSRARRVHLVVSLAGVDGVYDESMFDSYDAIACAGRHQVEDFKVLGERRKWEDKKLLCVGYPKLDNQRAKLAGLNKQKSDKTTVVFAPTHSYYINSKFSVLSGYGEKLIEAMINSGIGVIFRPHMESWRDQDRPVVDKILSKFSGNSLFSVDRSGDYFDAYSRSDVMLTDVSGTGFTYSFTFERPVIFFAPSEESEKGVNGIHFTRRENVGLVVRSIDDVVSVIINAKKHSDFVSKIISEFRDWLIFNPGSSERFVVDNIDDIAKQG